jgi:hypothetical protein
LKFTFGVGLKPMDGRSNSPPSLIPFLIVASHPHISISLSLPHIHTVKTRKVQISISSSLPPIHTVKTRKVQISRELRGKIGVKEKRQQKAPRAGYKLPHGDGGGESSDGHDGGEEGAPVEAQPRLPPSAGASMMAGLMNQAAAARGGGGGSGRGGGRGCGGEEGSMAKHCTTSVLGGQPLPVDLNMLSSALQHGARFRQKLTLEDAIGSHACLLQALAGVCSMAFLSGVHFSYRLPR